MANREQKFSSDEFKYVKFLGKGAFGLVFEVQKAAKSYAMKLCFVENEDSFETDKEKKVLQQTHHPNLVHLEDCWSEILKVSSATEGYKKLTKQITGKKPPPLQQFAGSLIIGKNTVYLQCFLVELCTRTLKEWLHDTLDTESNYVSNVDQIMSDLSSGLEYLHKKKVIHRDLKPENILEGVDKKWKIGDFGLCTRNVFDQENHSTKSVQISASSKEGSAGTYRYMAPEVRQGIRPSSAADIYSMGLIWAEMMMRHHPIDCIRSNQYDWFDKVVQDNSKSVLIRRMTNLLPPERCSAAELCTSFLPKSASCNSAIAPRKLLENENRVMLSSATSRLSLSSSCPVNVVSQFNEIYSKIYGTNPFNSESPGAFLAFGKKFDSPIPDRIKRREKRVDEAREFLQKLKKLLKQSYSSQREALHDIYVSMYGKPPVWTLDKQVNAFGKTFPEKPVTGKSERELKEIAVQQAMDFAKTLISKMEHLL